MPQQFKPGAIVPQSGIYRITHDPAHTEAHDVTAIEGRRFPPCRHCKGVRFELVRAARHLDEVEHMASGHAATA